MSISIICPSCDTDLDVPESLAGKKIRCTECDTVISVAAKKTAPAKPARVEVDDDEEQDRTPRRKAAPVKTQRDDDDEEDEEEEQPRKKAVAVKTSRSDDDDDRPQRKAKKSGKSSKSGKGTKRGRKDEDEDDEDDDEEKSKTGLYALIGGGAALVIAAVVGVVLMSGGKKDAVVDTDGDKKSDGEKTAWVKIENNDGFVVEMPGKPKEKTRTETEAEHPFAGKGYNLAGDKDDGYEVGYLELPTELFAAGGIATSQLLMNGFIDSAIQEIDGSGFSMKDEPKPPVKAPKASKGSKTPRVPPKAAKSDVKSDVKASPAKDIILNGFAGKEVIVLNISDDKPIGFFRIVIAGQRLYAIRARSDTTANFETQCLRFRDSFKITYKPPPPPPKESENIVKGDGCSAEMPAPGKPLIPPTIGVGKEHGLEHKLGTKTENYRIGWLPFRPHVGHPSGDFLKSVLDGETANIAAEFQMTGKNMNRTDVTLGGFKGRELSYVSESQKRGCIARAFYVGDRVYVAAVYGDDVLLSNPRVKTFFDSFKITYAPSSPPQDPVALKPKAPVPGKTGGVVAKEEASGQPLVGDDAPLKASFNIRFIAMAIDPENKEAYVISIRSNETNNRLAGMLHRYAYPNFEHQGDYRLPNLATHAVIDSKTGILYLAAVTAPNAANADRLLNEITEKTYAPGFIQTIDLDLIRSGKVARGGDVRPIGLLQSGTGTNIMGLELAPDGKSLYCLTMVNNKAVKPVSRLIQIDIVDKKAKDKDWTLPELAGSMKWNPEGDRLIIAEHALAPKNTSVMIVDPANWGKVEKTIEVPGMLSDIAVGKDGVIIACVAKPATGQIIDNKLMLLDGKGSLPKDISVPGAMANNAYAKFTPDGKYLIVSSRRAPGVDVYEMDPAATNGMKKIVSFNKATPERVGGHFHMTPDGRSIIFQEGNVLEVHRLTGGGRKK